MPETASAGWQGGGLPVIQGVPDLRIVVFQWSAKHGECHECGLPSAFIDRPYGDGEERRLCAVCAANSAAEGQAITRIEPLE